MTKVDFGDWLQKQLIDRGWNQSELSRRSGITTGQISRLINGSRKPGIDNLQAIANALGLPASIAFAAAGIDLEKNKPRRLQDGIIAYKTGELTTEQADEVLQFIEFIQDRDDKQHRREFLERHTKETREGQTPPEVVKKEKNKNSNIGVRYEP